MGGSGHISDMINRIKQNAILKNARRRKFKGGNDYSKTRNIKTEYDFPKLSKLKLQVFKKRIREEAKQEKRKRTTLIILGVLILFIALFVFNHY